MLGVMGGKPCGVIATWPWPGIWYPGAGIGGLISGYPGYTIPPGDSSGDNGCIWCCMCGGKAGSGAGGGSAIGPGCAGCD